MSKRAYRSDPTRAYWAEVGAVPERKRQIICLARIRYLLRWRTLQEYWQKGRARWNLRQKALARARARKRGA